MQRVNGRSCWLAAIGFAACFFVAGHCAAADDAPLPGTAKLEMQGDIASQLVEGVDRFLLREIDRSIERRAKFWHRDFSSPEKYAASVEPNRKRLAHMLGVRDERVLNDFPRPTATVHQGHGFDISTLRWPAFGDVFAEGLLVDGQLSTAQIIAIPDADQTPEIAGGIPWTLGRLTLDESHRKDFQFAGRLVESGCRVLIPTLVSREVQKHRNAKLTNREFIYRSAYELGRHVIGYDLQKILAGVDLLAKYRDNARTKGRSSKIGVIGWGEGGMLALYAAALDPRIDAVCVSGYFASRQSVWQEPVDRNVFGLLEQLGDAEIASLVAPRPLVIEAARGPQFVMPPGTGGAPGRLVTPNLEDVKREVERTRVMMKGHDGLSSVDLVVSGDGGGFPGSSLALEKFLAALDPNAQLAPPEKDTRAPDLAHELYQPIDAHNARQARLVHELDRHNQQLLLESAEVRKKYFENLDTSSLETFQQTIEPYREKFYNEVIGRFDYPLLPPNVRTRKAYDEPKYVGYEVVLDVFPDVIAYGILLVPKDIDIRADQRGQSHFRGGKTGAEGQANSAAKTGTVSKRPVVVCQHGLEGRAQDTLRGGKKAYAEFASKLADEGFITFSPQNLYIFGDRFRTLQRKANPLGKTLFSIIVPQHQQIVDWLGTLPFVDKDRIAFYGLSYGGKTAMRVPPLVKGYCLSICSGDFNEWVWKNASTHSPYSYVDKSEYEIFEFDLGSTFNYAEMAALIAPRPFMVERGHFDGVAPDEMVAYEFAKVRFLYEAKLGIGDRCRLEWFTGPHMIHGVGTFEFLREKLNWPRR